MLSLMSGYGPTAVLMARGYIEACYLSDNKHIISLDVSLVDA